MFFSLEKFLTQCSFVLLVPAPPAVVADSTDSLKTTSLKKLLNVRVNV